MSTSLGCQFELAGGNIRNLVLAAASLTADEDSMIGMKHFVPAVARAWQKLGKMPSRADFREYYGLTRAGA
jgi:hypothetical protein